MHRGVNNDCGVKRAGRSFLERREKVPSVGLRSAEQALEEREQVPGLAALDAAKDSWLLLALVSGPAGGARSAILRSSVETMVWMRLSSRKCRRASSPICRRREDLFLVAEHREQLWRVRRRAGHRQMLTPA
jgi:hypothetical protein